MQQKLGEILRRHDLLTDEQLVHALALQKRSGSRLGDVLIGEGMIGYLPLYQAIAEHYNLPFVDLIKEPPDFALFDKVHPEECLALRVIPWRIKDGKPHVAVSEMSYETVRWSRRQFGKDVMMVITSPHDIRRAIETRFSIGFESKSRLSLWQRFPDISARTIATTEQKNIFYAIAILALGTALFSPLAVVMAFMALCHLAYSATMIFKCIAFAEGNSVPTGEDWTARIAALDEHSLPVYTVLVPMYHETPSLPRLLQALENLDYPTSKLDIKLVLEADDAAMIQAAFALKPSHHFDIIRVPPGMIRTKPKACNYALHFARGEMVTVFDADDVPDPLQLKKAVITLRNMLPEVACLQARLNYFNTNDNLLTRFFSLEYTMLFHFMLYGLERIGIPIPLGGTSNHIALSRLKGLGEWDPYNVTEDADLGTRLAAQGMRTAMLDSYTMEEAPNTIALWVRQRSRWIKGYMQTWLVHMRQPVTLAQSLGFKGFLGFQCFIGLPCFSFLTAPIVWALSFWLISHKEILHHSLFADWLIWVGITNLVLYLITHWGIALYSALLYEDHRPSMIIAALFYPFYLILHTIASYRAFWQLIVRPHFWDKTIHGLAKPPMMALSEEK